MAPAPPPSFLAWGAALALGVLLSQLPKVSNLLDKREYAAALLHTGATLGIMLMLVTVCWALSLTGA